MKTLVTFLGLFIATLTVSQAQDLEAQLTTQDVEITDFSVSVTVDSAKEVETVFKMKDIKNILEHVGEDQEITFEITCKDKHQDSKMQRKMSYRAKGNSNDKKAFLKVIKKIRKASIAYYTNKA